MFKRLFAAAAILCLLSGFANFSSAFSQTATAPADIKNKIEEALRILPAAGSPADPVWRDDANRLRARLTSLAIEDGTAAAIQRSSELETLLRTLSASTNPGLRAAIDKLNEATAAIEANEPLLAFGKRLNRLEVLTAGNGFPATHSDVIAGLGALARITGKIESNDAAVKFKLHGDTIAAILSADPALTGGRATVLATSQQLLPLLEKLEAADPVVAIQRRSASTEAIVGEFVEGKALAKAPEVQSALTSLADKIAAAATPLLPRVHVIDALYGDLTPRASASRTCSATAAMVHQCERKTNCNMPANAVDLCGYDPASQASEATKGLRVRFQCVTAIDRVWAELAGGVGLLAKNVQVRRIEIRNDKQEIACLIRER